MSCDVTYFLYDKLTKFNSAFMVLLYYCDSRHCWFHNWMGIYRPLTRPSLSLSTSPSCVSSPPSSPDNQPTRSGLEYRKTLQKLSSMFAPSLGSILTSPGARVLTMQESSLKSVQGSSLIPAKLWSFLSQLLCWRARITHT